MVLKMPKAELKWMIGSHSLQEMFAQCLYVEYQLKINQKEKTKIFIWNENLPLISKIYLNLTFTDTKSLM